MGLFDMTDDIEDYLPNSTKCMTWQDVKASHEKDNPQVVVRLDDIYGMVIILALGLGGAVVAFTVECLSKAQKQKRFMNTPDVTSKWLIARIDKISIIDIKYVPNLQGSAKEWSLGCVIPASWPLASVEGGALHAT